MTRRLAGRYSCGCTSAFFWASSFFGSAVLSGLCFFCVAGESSCIVKGVTILILLDSSLLFMLLSDSTLATRLVIGRYAHEVPHKLHNPKAKRNHQSAQPNCQTMKPTCRLHTSLVKEQHQPVKDWQTLADLHIQPTEKFNLQNQPET